MHQDYRQHKSPFVSQGKKLPHPGLEQLQANNDNVFVFG